MRIATAFLLLLSIIGCAPFAQPPDLPTITQRALPVVPETWREAQERVGPVQVHWVDQLNDPLLSALVVEAQANNRDLQAAAAAIDQARALLRQARSPLFPAINVSGGASKGGPLKGSSTSGFNVGLESSWELDVWGRVRAQHSASAYNVYSAEADYVFSQYSLAAAVAQAYFQSIEARLQEDVARKSFMSLQETDRIVSAQRALGASSALDEALSEANLANARATLADAEGGKRLAVRALEVLLGRYPENTLELALSLPALPAPQAVGVPSALLERRPDVIAAEMSIAAAFSGLNAARAARLPTISLRGSLDGSASRASDVLNSSNSVWQLASNLLGPLFDAGLRRAQVEEADALAQQSIANYARVALIAFQEVENSLDQNRVLAERAEALAAAAEASNRAFKLSQLRYREGETDLLDVLTIQFDTFSADSALVTVQRQQLDEWIALRLALGGAW